MTMSNPITHPKALREQIAALNAKLVNPRNPYLCRKERDYLQEKLEKLVQDDEEALT
tara:strand:+ start:36 stop:206 length:171 start_codon:yes stop_codon:yes gene_type:complete